jgi:hypothetical protein
MQIVNKIYTFLIYVILTQELGQINMKFLCNTKHTKMFLKEIMLTCCLNIDHTILRLTLKREHNPHSNPFATYPKMEKWHFGNTLMKI